MSTLTPNLSLVKPDGTDPAQISVINGNMDILDNSVTLSGGQTLINKTLTAPTINSATITGPSITGGATISGNVSLTGNLTALTGLALASGNLTMSAVASQLIPGSTSFAIRNNANSENNLIITNAGVATIRAGLTVTAGGTTITAGNLGVNVTLAGNVGVYVQGTLSGATSQYGGLFQTTANSSATAAVVGVAGQAITAASAFTCTSAISLQALAVSEGAGSTITSAYGVHVAAQTVGGSNYGVYIEAPSGGVLNAGLWNLGSALVNGSSTQLAFFGEGLKNKQTVSGSVGGNVALAGLITALSLYGLISDNTSA